jgi:hypothetical protein
MSAAETATPGDVSALPPERLAAAQRVRRVVTGVCAAAVADSGASGIVVMAADSPEGALLADWLEDAAAGWQVWQGSSATAGDALVAYPACKTALLLAGRLPHCDLLPLGDLWASQIVALGGGWSADGALQDVVAAAGGVAALDGALQRLVEARMPAGEALRELPAGAAGEVERLWEAGRWWRRHTGLVPKLTSRTLGIDLFD